MRGTRALSTLILLAAFLLLLAGHAKAQEATSLKGDFRGVGHDATGTASVTANADGTKTLRFKDFRVDWGPNLYVYLVALDDAPDSKSVSRAEFVSLGTLSSTAGDQDYVVSATTDLDTFRSVVIWCKLFGVNFAVAPLGR